LVVGNSLLNVLFFNRLYIIPQQDRFVNTFFEIFLKKLQKIYLLILSDFITAVF
jgi:hypothetical protein